MIRPCAGVAAFALAMWSAMVMPRAVMALDLPEALRQAASANPTLAARAAMVDAARRRVGPAGAWAAPMLELGVVNVPTTGRFDMDPMTMKMIGVSQRVPVFGSNRLARRAAREGVNLESAAAEMTGFEIYGMTWEAYADVYFASELARSAEGHVAVMDRLVQSARARFESGNGRLEDLLRAQAEQGRTLADLASFRAEEWSARARLDELRGVPPGGAPDSLAPLPGSAVPPGADAWLAAVVPSHPRLREMDAQVSRYRFSARAARRMAWPDLELRASYGRRGTLDGGIGQDNMFNAMVGFMLPIFSGARELSEGAEMDAMARASEAERRGVELELRRQIASTHAMAAAAQRTVSLLADTVTTIQHRAVEASWTSYRAGATDLWRVFESTHALYAEEIALVRARQELARSQARLVSLTGRGDLLGVALPGTRSER
jgi:outer membrane protein, heavy metal efflux system